ncbi:MAG: RNA-binding domain-containing protein [Thermodesulfobacteriota bacterium]
MMPNSTARIRNPLLLHLALLIVLVVGALVAATFWIGRELREEVFTRFVTVATEQARKEFHACFSPMTDTLALVRGWGRAGDLDVTDTVALNARFMPFLEMHTDLSAILLARSDGVLYFLLHNGGEWLTRSQTEPQNPGAAVWRRWKGPGEILDERRADDGVDPRQRPWYQGALEQGQGGGIFWTSPYVFQTLRQPGVTLAVSWNDGHHTYVAAFDVLLDRIAEAVRTVGQRQEDKVFLVTDRWTIFDASGRPAAGKQPAPVEAYFHSPATYPAPGVAAAVAAWQQRGRQAAAAFRYTAQGEPFWAGFQSLGGPGRLWLGCCLPERALSESMGSRRGPYFVAVGLILAGAGAAAWMLVRRHSRRLQQMPARLLEGADPVQAALEVIRSGESDTVEFKSTMRMNLHTGKPGKEMELAWLKTVAAFLNTSGGILFFGVGDDGAVLGMEADGFPSGDKCRLHFENLISQHIGMEHARSLRFTILSIDGKSVGAVACERSDSPVFLKTSKEEAFYIRSGPSSIQLPVSKVLSYLKNPSNF